MILAIDAGNTRVKWGMHDGSMWRAQGSVMLADIIHLAEAWRYQPTPDRVIISNVAGEKIRSELVVLLAHWHREPIVIRAQQQECGVTNTYQDPSQLGSDRWAALVAARSLHEGSALVVSAGTAVTIDALSSDGRFLGGLILPGADLMQDALAGRTVGIRRTNGELQRFPTCTADAVFSGALQAMAGAVGRMQQLMAEGGEPSPTVFLCGGNYQLLQPLLPGPLQVVDNLVLEGLVRIAAE